MHTETLVVDMDTETLVVDLERETVVTKRRERQGREAMTCIR